MHVVSGYLLNARLIERAGDWAVVAWPGHTEALVHLPTGARAAIVDTTEDADRVRPALRELAQLERFDLQNRHLHLNAIREVLKRHGIRTHTLSRGMT